MSDCGTKQCDSCQSKQTSVCETCSSSSDAGQTGQIDQHAKISKNIDAITNRIAIVSGKGGVGKSTVTAGIAYNLAKKGFKVGVLDADVSGPNIPHLLNVEGEKLQGSSEGLLPVIAAHGIRIASAESLVESSDSPIVWRGPMRSSLINQFLADMQWGELDFLLVDLPPGTGDEPLSIMQTIPLTGLVMVSTPSSLSILDVSKIINMARMLKVDMLGILENMAFYECPGCRERVFPFGEGKVKALSDKYDLRFLGQLPLDPLNGGRDIITADDSPTVSMTEEITDKILNILKR